MIIGTACFPRGEPLLHRLNLAALRELDLLAHRDQLRRLGMRGDHRHHQERLIVVMDHALHELHVVVRVVVVVKRGDLETTVEAWPGAPG